MKPAQLGYRMPAEWEPHIGTWFTWPRPEGISFPDKYDSVPAVYAELIKQLVQVEEVHINVWNEEKEMMTKEVLRTYDTPLDLVHFHHFPAYEPWCRDHGPIFIVREKDGMRERAIVDWGYNAWGGKYPPYDLDDRIPQHVGRYRNLEVYSPGIVMEGGSIEVNGKGTLLTTTACLLNPNRNPHLNREQIEQHLKDYLGVRHILWLGEGIIGDDTDGHIDDISRFTDSQTIVTVIEDDPQDENYAILKENYEKLKTFRDQDGQPFRIVTIPMPGVVQHEDQRLPASYANFYIANQIVLVPTYRNRRNDQRALETLQSLFPDRRVIGIDSTELIWGLGSFHCISQQEPA
jgi:agmatine deiminase